jgi:hypothetical protein
MTNVKKYLYIDKVQTIDLAIYLCNQLNLIALTSNNLICKSFENKRVNCIKLTSNYPYFCV